jgi:hypothetical protein
LLKNSSILEIDRINCAKLQSLICGYRLNSLVFGQTSLRIFTLSLDLNHIGKDYIPLIAQIVAPTLSSLNILFSKQGYGHLALKSFFSRCQSIRNLRLESFEFDEDSLNSPIIRNGLSWLYQLSLVDCEGERLFIENIPIPALKSFRYSSGESVEVDIEVVEAIALNYGNSLVNLDLGDCWISSSNFVTISKNCLKLEKITIMAFEEGNVITRSDLKTITSLPLLKCFVSNEDWEVSDDAVSAFVERRGLNHLEIEWDRGLIDVIRAIGQNLVTLKIWRIQDSVGAINLIDVIIKHCSNLQYLELKIGWVSEKVVESAKVRLKDGLKKLAKLTVSDECVRLGTDWEGYRDEYWAGY